MPLGEVSSRRPSQAWAPAEAAYLDAAGVRLEAARGVLGGDPALDGAAVDADVLLPEAQIWQAPALGHVDLGVDQVHTAGGGTGEGDSVRQGMAVGSPGPQPSPASP